MRNYEVSPELNIYFLGIIMRIILLYEDIQILSYS